jgi:hypothetical protein
LPVPMLGARGVDPTRRVRETTLPGRAEPVLAEPAVAPRESASRPVRAARRTSAPAVP